MFLASPGDLEKERYITRSVVEDLNTSLARRFGFHLELMGWEDTLPGFGRPQAIINRDLEQCEFFIGLLWERWGSPTGAYSSGFEEEYEIAIESREKDGSPDIAIYLKDIDPLRAKDPGPQLQKVLNFKDRLVSERKVLFENFSTDAEIERKVRAVLTDKLITLWEDDLGVKQNSSERDEVGDGREAAKVDSDPNRKPLLSVEELRFLHGIQELGAGASTENIDRLGVARLRLLSGALRTDGNDKTTIGPHDANILFSNRERVALSGREIAALIDAGIAHFTHENAPIWHWLYGVTHFGGSWLPLCSLGISPGGKAAAIDVMKVVREPLPLSVKPNKADYLRMWLEGDDQSQEVKVAAIRYLGVMGSSDDIATLLREVNKGDYRTVSAAKDAVLGLALADSRSKALQLLLKQELVSISDSTLDHVFGDGKGIDTNMLRSCLKYHETGVRIRAITILRERKEISQPDANALLKDESSVVRLQALLSLLDGGQGLPLGEARRALLRRTGGGLFSAIGSTTGQEQYDAYRAQYLLAMTEAQLLAAIEDGPLYEQDAFIALCNKKFSKYRNQLVKSLKVNFTDRFDDAVARLRALHGEDTLVAEAASLRESFTANLTKKGLDVLCEFGDKEALPLVRRLVSEFEVSLSPQIARFLKRYGEWDDIALIADAVNRPDSPRRASLLSLPNRHRDEAIQAIYQIGKNRLLELRACLRDQHLMAPVIYMSTAKAFKQLSDDDILELLNDRRDQVRRVAALKSVLHLSKTRAKKILHIYLENDIYR
ncbi:hypothetical protein, partial [cf. Phormidesmis sp. LEGE 11477]|uniref:hypothetical protein n=1 Tax=cf. Phormidesmis sp. LEGE 11477 TaxID=1828680 RepID=UPI0019F674B1|nr:hypothetical protein [cf. Phormidesmis sp. LEGE 11477]